MRRTSTPRTSAPACRFRTWTARPARAASICRPESVPQPRRGQREVDQPGAGFNVSPTLPPGKYTFQIKNVYGDLDLRVKANGLVSASVYDCASVKGRNAEESCTVTLDAPGYLSVMVTGYANQSCNSTAPTGCTCAGNVSGCAATGTVIGHNGNSTLINGGLIVL